MSLLEYIKKGGGRKRGRTNPDASGFALVRRPGSSRFALVRRHNSSGFVRLVVWVRPGSSVIVRNRPGSSGFVQVRPGQPGRRIRMNPDDEPGRIQTTNRTNLDNILLLKIRKKIMTINLILITYFYYLY
jgi:hypothetical protein